MSSARSWCGPGTENCLVQSTLLGLSLPSLRPKKSTVFWSNPLSKGDLWTPLLTETKQSYILTNIIHFNPRTSLKVFVSGRVHPLVGCHGQPDHLVSLAHGEAAHPDEVKHTHDQYEQDLQHYSNIQCTV